MYSHILRNTIFALLFFVLSAYSQLSKTLFIEGSPKLELSEIVSNEIRDANGIVCSGIIIFSDLNGMAYQSNNGIVKRNSNPGKDFLFVSPDERVLEVYCSGYTPLKIYFNEIGIKLKSGQTWSLKITGDKSKDSISINFIVKPEKSELFIDKINKRFNYEQYLTEGKHLIRIQKDGYKPFVDSINVTKSKTLFTINLEELNLVWTTISSDPESAKIFLNNKQYGVTNKQLYLLPQKYSLKLVKNGYIEKSDTVEIENDSNSIKKYKLVKNIGFLEILANPIDAVVLLDGNIINSKNRLEITPGKHKIQIDKDGYISQEDDIEIIFGQAFKKKYNLKKNSGILFINSEPQNSRILINKVTYSGENAIELLPGGYKINISKDNYNDVNDYIEISVGDTIKKSYSLVAREGDLQLTINPINAKVSLVKNGKLQKKWEGANVIKNLLAGEYKLIVIADGYKTEEKSIFIEYAQKNIYEINMQLLNDSDKVTKHNANPAIKLLTQIGNEVINPEKSFVTIEYLYNKGLGYSNYSVEARAFSVGIGGRYDIGSECFIKGVISIEYCKYYFYENKYLLKSVIDRNITSNLSFLVKMYDLKNIAVEGDVGIYLNWLSIDQHVYFIRGSGEISSVRFPIGINFRYNNKLSLNIAQVVQKQIVLDKWEYNGHSISFNMDI